MSCWSPRTGSGRRPSIRSCACTRRRGRTSLYANPHHIVRIQGMSEADSDALVKELTPYMIATPAQYQHKWRVGDIVIWDNRCGLHKACGGHPPDEPRIHWRTTIMQDEIQRRLAA